jgi:hypothetical protein
VPWRSGSRAWVARLGQVRFAAFLPLGGFLVVAAATGRLADPTQEVIALLVAAVLQAALLKFALARAASEALRFALLLLALAIDVVLLVVISRATFGLASPLAPCVALPAVAAALALPRAAALALIALAAAGGLALAFAEFPPGAAPWPDFARAIGFAVTAGGVGLVALWERGRERLLAERVRRYEDEEFEAPPRRAARLVPESMLEEIAPLPDEDRLKPLFAALAEEVARGDDPVSRDLARRMLSWLAGVREGAPADVRSAVLAARDRHEEALGRRGVRLKVEAAKSLPVVAMLDSELRLVLDLLLERAAIHGGERRAAKSSPRGARARLRAAPFAAGGVVIEYEDAIEGGDLDSGSARPGLRLAAAFVAHVAAAAGGRLEVSGAAGGGARLRVEVPALTRAR